MFWKLNISNKFGLNLETVFSYTSFCQKTSLLTIFGKLDHFINVKIILWKEIAFEKS